MKEWWEIQETCPCGQGMRLLIDEEVWGDGTIDIPKRWECPTCYTWPIGPMLEVEIHDEDIPF